MKITLSKKQWSDIGKKAGWMKKAQITGEETFNVKEPTSNIDRQLKGILGLWEKEQEYKSFSDDISQMPFAAQEDLDAGYGNAVSGKDYQESLREPYVYISKGSGDFIIYFYGNNSPYSVNAGRPTQVYIDEINERDVRDLVMALKTKNIPIEMAPVASKLLKG